MLHPTQTAAYSLDPVVHPTHKLPAKKLRARRNHQKQRQQQRRSLSQQEQEARRIKRQRLLVQHTLPCASSSVFEADQIYLVDDHSVCGVLYLYVGRAVPQDLLEELFLLPRHAPYDRPADLGLRPDSVLGRRLQALLDAVHADSVFVPGTDISGAYMLVDSIDLSACVGCVEVKVVWADVPQAKLMPKFSSRLLEDASAGSVIA